MHTPWILLTERKSKNHCDNDKMCLPAVSDSLSSACLVLFKGLNFSNKLYVSAKQMPSAFHVLTGWKCPGLRKDARGLKEQGYCSACCWLGLLVICKVVSLIGARNQITGKQVFYFTYDLFPLSGRFSWGCYAFSQSFLSMAFRWRLREYSILIYFMCWPELAFSIKFSINTCYQTAYTFCVLNIILVVVWKTSILILALNHFIYFHFLTLL